MSLATRNAERVAAWRRRMREHGYYYDLRAHIRQLTNGIDWDHRWPRRRATDANRFSRGRIRLGLDGFLPTKPPRSLYAVK